MNLILSLLICTLIIIHLEYLSPPSFTSFTIVGMSGITLMMIVAAIFYSIILAVYFRRTPYLDQKADKKISSQSQSLYLKKASKVINSLTRITLIVSGLAILAYIPYFIPKITQPHVTVMGGLGIEFERFWATMAFAFLLEFTYLSLFFIPFLIALPLTVHVAQRWKHPTRILLLRPFHRNYLTRELKFLVKKYISFNGHTYTISDTTIKVPWYVRIPIFLGQLGLFQFQLRKIKKPQQLRSLSRALTNRWMRSVNWCMSSNKIFPIRTTDKLWQTVVTNTISEMDIVFIDLSFPSHNILWEIEICRQKGIIRNLIFLVQDEHREEAKKLLEKLFQETFQPPLFDYDDSGNFRSKTFLESYL